MKWSDWDNLVYRNDDNDLCIYKSALLQIAGKVEEENHREIPITEMVRKLKMIQKGIDVT